MSCNSKTSPKILSVLYYEDDAEELGIILGSQWVEWYNDQLKSKSKLKIKKAIEKKFYVMLGEALEMGNGRNLLPCYENGLTLQEAIQKIEDQVGKKLFRRGDE